LGIATILVEPTPTLLPFKRRRFMDNWLRLAESEYTE